MKGENIVLLICAVLSFFIVFAFNGVLVIIPTIAKEYGMSNIVQNWVTIIFLLIVSVVSIPAGQLSGKYGLKKVTILSIILFMVFTVVNVFATSTEMFLFCRLMLGVSIAFINVTSMSMVVSAFKPEERGQALGITITGVYVALFLSPFIAGVFNFQFGWRSVVLFPIPFLIGLLVLLLTKVDDEWITFADVPFDYKGSIVYGIGMMLFIYGFTTLNQSSGVILTIVGIIFLILFAYIELRQAYPVFDVRFFKNRLFLSSNFASLCAYLATFSATTILNYHLQYIKGFDSQTAGMILLVAPIFQVVLAPIAGRLSDKYIPQIFAAIGMVLGTISLILFSFLNESSSLMFLIIGMVFFGIGFGLFSPPNTNVIMSSVPPKDTSVASAAVSTMRTLGQTMSMGILTLVFAFVMGNVPIVPEYYPLLISASQITCIICIILCLASIFASFVGIKSSDKVNDGLKDS